MSTQQQQQQQQQRVIHAVHCNSHIPLFSNYSFLRSCESISFTFLFTAQCYAFTDHGSEVHS